MKKVKIAVTGAAGQIGYALIFRIASGEMFGQETQVELNLLELETALPKLGGVKMEIEDCAFPLLSRVVISANPDEVFQDVDWALLVGSVPRIVGMERSDLLKINGGIFVKQGKSLDAHAKSNCKVLVVGNPCNTNAYIAKSVCRRIPPKNFFALTMLDQKRAMNFLAQKAGVPVSQVHHLAVWGNHSTTQFPDFFHASIGDKKVLQVIPDESWLRNDFIKNAQLRGAEVLKARNGSAAASAANAVIETVQALRIPAPNDDVFSLAVSSDGSYNVPEGLMFSFPVRSNGQDWQIVPGIRHNDFAEEKIKLSREELIAERDLIQPLSG